MEHSLNLLGSIFEIPQVESFNKAIEKGLVFDETLRISEKLQELQAAIRMKDTLGNNRFSMEDSMEFGWYEKDQGHDENQPSSLNPSSSQLINPLTGDLASSKDSYLRFSTVKRPPCLIINDLDALDLFMVKHLSVVNLASLLEPHISMNELLSLVGSRKVSFWSKVVSTITGVKQKKILKGTHILL